MTDDILKSTDFEERSVAANFRPGTANDDNMTVEIEMASEAPFKRRNFDGYFNEVLDLNPASVRTARLDKGVQFLDNHNIFGSVTRSVLGVVESYRFAEGKLIGKVRFSKNKPEAKVVYQDIRDGILRSFSIGYFIHDYEIRSPESEMPEHRITDWEPYELSTVGVPADYTVNSRSAKDGLIISKMAKEANNNVAEDQVMSPSNDEGKATPAQTRAGGDGQSAPAIDNQASRTRAASAQPAEAPSADVDAAVRAERNRISRIRSHAKIAGVEDSRVEDMITRGLSFEAAADEITNLWVQRGAESPKTDHSGTSVKKDDQLDLAVRGISDAILYRSGDRKIEVDDNARRFVGMSMVRVAERILSLRGVDTSGLSDRGIIDTAFRTRAGMHSTSDFPILLGNTINRSLRRQYAEQARTFQPWTNRGTFSDFREKTVTQMSGLVGNLEKVNEGGEFKRGTFTEAAESYKLATYGKIIDYTRQMAINDDLDAFRRIPQALASAAARLQSNLVYGLLVDNPLMSDGNALFSVDHGNLAGSGAAPSVATIGAGYTAMRKQKGLTADEYLDIMPRYLIVGPDNELAAKQVLTTITPNKVVDVNLFSSSYDLIVDPRLGSAWFLAADPSQIDTIEYGFLDGEELYTETQTGFEVDGTSVKIRMDFGTKAIDWRGLYMNPGA